MSVDALFDSGPGGTWTPTELSRGPWSVDSLHGGPPAALLARALEPLLAPLQPVRLTVELLRPIGLMPLRVETEVVRDGRKVRLVRGHLLHDGTEVAMATALGIRTADVVVPEQPASGPPPGPDEGATLAPRAIHDGFHNKGVEHRFVHGMLGQPGPGTDWIRLLVPLVVGEEPSPLQRVAAAADFGNGVSGLDDMGAMLFINPDLTIHLHRVPEGEWICLDAVSRYEANGIGLATSHLFDEHGSIGRSLQSLLVDRP